MRRAFVAIMLSGLVLSFACAPTKQAKAPDPSDKASVKKKPVKTGPTPEQKAAAEKAFSILRDDIIAAMKKQGIEAAMPWDSLAPEQFYGLAKKYSKNKDALDAYRIGHGL